MSVGAQNFCARPDGGLCVLPVAGLEEDACLIDVNHLFLGNVRNPERIGHVVVDPSLPAVARERRLAGFDGCSLAAQREPILCPGDLAGAVESRDGLEAPVSVPEEPVDLCSGRIGHQLAEKGKKHQFDATKDLSAFISCVGEAPNMTEVSSPLHPPFDRSSGGEERILMTSPDLGRRKAILVVTAHNCADLEVVPTTSS